MVNNAEWNFWSFSLFEQRTAKENFGESRNFSLERLFCPENSTSTRDGMRLIEWKHLNSAQPQLLVSWTRTFISIQTHCMPSSSSLNILTFHSQANTASSTNIQIRIWWPQSSFPNTQTVPHRFSHLFLPHPSEKVSKLNLIKKCCKRVEHGVPHDAKNDSFFPLQHRLASLIYEKCAKSGEFSPALTSAPLSVAGVVIVKKVFKFLKYFLHLFE